MKMLAALALAALALPSTAVLAAPAAPMAPAKTDWTKRVVVTAEGGFLMGNPAAKAKLVEYGSLSCPYCQRFHQEAIAGIRARVATGETSFEFRPFAVHSADPILHALLRCAGPARYTKFSDDFYADQATLVGPYETWAQANPTIDPNKLAADRVAFADQWGFTAFAMGHGLSRAKAHACITKSDVIDAQRAAADKANKELGVASTPTFLLNGQKLETYAWPAIDQAIAAVLAA